MRRAGSISRPARPHRERPGQIAPGQLGAGLVTALGTPYFVWLLWRGRAARGR
ncbi:hypothetical protein W824_09150 [Clavibacter cf. michiganensis LMG 26808]|nr:hypothetical protein W824_09150 [Clavibacter cf. michiganensis LMG 26808]